MRVVLLLAGSFLHLICLAQQCYLVDSIRSVPAAPTTADAVSLLLYGDLIGARTLVNNASVRQEDQAIIIHIEASCDSNTAIVLPHREELPLGALPNGRYRLRFEGSGAVMMDTAATLLVVPYAGRYQSPDVPSELMRFDESADELILDIDPSLFVVRVRIYDASAKVRREAFIDGLGTTRISTKGLPDGNYFVRVDCDTGSISRWASIRRQHDLQEGEPLR